MPSADTDAKSPVPWPTASLVTAAVGVIFLLYFGHEFFVPVAVAILLSILFRPPVRWLERRRIPPAGGATVVVLLLVGAIGAAGFGLAVPIRSWASKLPQTVAQAREKLADLRGPVQQLNAAATQLENPDAGQPSAPTQAAAPRKSPRTRPPSLPRRRSCWAGRLA